MYLLGLDIGTSSIKSSILDVNTGICAASCQSPETEMEILSLKAGWAEQDPEIWWEHTQLAIAAALNKAGIEANEIKAIGISYQMHGLVCVDKDLNVLRNAIIWCDSRAVETGNQAFREISHNKCLSRLLNSPGNFTASKLKWVKENEPDIYNRIHKVMLPGDFIAAKLTGEIKTTESGLSEGILWDFINREPADFLLNNYGVDKSLLAEITPTFGLQGSVNAESAAATGLKAGTPVCYRAGDQPNNAFSLNVLNPGEIAATAGTSGVVYGVSNQVKYDPKSRVNTFVHVNNLADETRNGILLCVNGTGSLNSWVKKMAGENLSYSQMNAIAASVKPGSDGLLILPFGNGAERVLENIETGCSIQNLNFNIHGKAHLFRAAQEGIAFAFYYGIKIMQDMGVDVKVIRAGKANMFLSSVFCQTLADISGATIELYNTDGAQGAARGAGVGAGIYKDFETAFAGLIKLETIVPSAENQNLKGAYQNWKKELQKQIN
ncbi:MAG: FGGY family carbohydrate kinase [Bacteroidota bacterium]